MSEIEKALTEDDKLNTSNIFDEFDIDGEIINELEENKVKKDWMFYIQKIWNFFVYVNFILFIIVVSLFSYIYIETSDSNLFNSKEYLDSIWICNFLNWTDTSFMWACSWLSHTIQKIDFLNKKQSEENLEKVIDILKKSYEINSIKNSKEALFLIDKSKNKNDPIKILNEFDILKNDFASVEKRRIQCDNIIIDWNILKASCSSYSAGWYKNIPWFKWEKTIYTLKWTSITLASSFINYLWNSSMFNVINKQKMFESVPYFWEWNFSHKTNFKIEIQYNDIRNLPL